MTIAPELYQTIVNVVDARMAEIRVMREDFNALTMAVHRLAEAQARSEERLSRVEAAVERLAEAQVRTEERLDRVEAAVERLAEAQARSEERLSRVEAAVERLAEAQVRTEERLDRVEAAVERLAEAQQRTDERVAELTEAQRRTDERLAELAEAQRRTEVSVQKLSEEMRGLRQQVGRLSEVVGMGLEDIARITLPGYLERHLGVRLDGELGEELTRWIVGPEGRELEFDLYGEGRRDGRAVTVVGETKSRIYSDDVRRFLDRMQKVEHLLAGEVIKVMFGYVIHPVATQFGREQGVVLVASYQR